MTKKKDAELQNHQNQTQNLEKITFSSLLASAVDAKPKVLKFTDSALLAYQTDFKSNTSVRTNSSSLSRAYINVNASMRSKDQYLLFVGLEL